MERGGFLFGKPEGKGSLRKLRTDLELNGRARLKSINK
jgi:hypothetical protein